MKNNTVILQAFFSWSLFIATAFLLRIFSQTVLEPRFPLIVTEIFGVIAGVFFACVVAYWFLHKGWFPADRRNLYLIGALWIAFSVAFEFLFYGAVMGQQLSAIIEVYRIDQGRLSVLLLIALFFIPMGVAQRNEVID